MMKWSQKETKLLTQKWSVPPDIPELVRLLGRSRFSIYAKAKQLALPTQPGHVTTWKGHDLSDVLEKFLLAFKKERVQKRALRQSSLDYRALQRELDRNLEFKARYDQVLHFLSETLACGVCGHIGPPEDFYVKPKDRVFGICKPCDKKRGVQYRKTKRGKLFALARGARSRQPGSTLVGKEVLALWQIQSGKCFYTGRPLILNDPNRWDGVSIDRKDPGLPYTAGNCVLTTVGVNTMKGWCSVDEFVQTCQEVVAHVG